MMLQFLQARFGEVPADLRAAVLAIQDDARLTALVEAAARCPDLATFQARLASRS
jgi:hypothetical protein